MQARIIHTKIWEDSFFSELSTQHKLLFLYYFTNSHVNIIHFYEIPDRTVLFETGVNKEVLGEFKEKVQVANRYLYYKDFCYIVNGERYQSFTGIKNEEAKNKITSKFSDDVFEFYKRVLDTPIYTPIKGVYIPSSNQYSVTSNKKPIENKEVFEFLESYNRIFKKKLVAVVGFQKNFTYWRQHYSLDDMAHALEVAYKDEKTRAYYTPVILLRTKTPNGEDTDNIGSLLTKWKPPVVNTPQPSVMDDPPISEEQRQKNLAKLEEMRKNLLNRKHQDHA